MTAKKRHDHAGDGSRLSDSPFAALRQTLPGEDRTESVDSPAPSSTTRAWSVEKARKGGWKLSLVKKPGGKVATVLEGVQGDATGLLKALRKHCGAGGAGLEPGALEIQGDHRRSISDWLDQRGGVG
jgi:translation initiation factor 1 (eIF-1/SUI1)